MRRPRIIVTIALVFVSLTTVFGRQSDQGSTSQSSSSNQQSASAGTAEKTSAPAPEFARLRIYRQRRYVGSALAPSIYVDEKQVARVGNGRRCTLKLAPGPHTIKSDDKSSAISLDAKAGQEYFIRVDEAAGFWKGHGKLTMLMPDQGSAEYKLQKPIEPDRRIAKDMLEEDVEEAPAKPEEQQKKDEGKKK